MGASDERFDHTSTGRISSTSCTCLSVGTIKEAHKYNINLIHKNIKLMNNASKVLTTQLTSTCTTLSQMWLAMELKK